jgi:hypothetical protein
MSGLLNMGPQDEALLALGLGLLNSKGSFGNALGQAGMQSMQTLNQAKERERMARQQALQEQMANMQLQQAQRQQAEQQAAAERESQFRSRLAPVGPGQAASMPGGPTPQNAQQIGQGPDWQALALQFPDKADMIAKLAGAKNFGRDEVKEFVETADGRQGVSKYGDRVGTPFALPPDIQLINLGGKTVGVDKRKAVGQSFAHSMTPDGIAADARGRESNAISRARLGIEQSQGGKPPPGYRFTADGSLEAIPGGPADIKAGEAGKKAESRRQGVVAGANSVIDAIEEAKQMVGHTTAGFGGMASVIPASNARNLRAKLDTIKANIGFDRLQQMREASPTGGALGQVAVQELNSLQATLGSLDQMQAPSELAASLDKIEGHYRRWLEAVGAARKAPPKLDGKALEDAADAIIRGN